MLACERLAAEAGARAAKGGVDSLGALALLPCFFSVVKTSKMSCENGCSCSLLGLLASLTCRVRDLMTFLIQLVGALHRARCSGGLHMKTAVVWAGVGVVVF